MVLEIPFQASQHHPFHQLSKTAGALEANAGGHLAVLSIATRLLDFHERGINPSRQSLNDSSRMQENGVSFYNLRFHQHCNVYGRSDINVYHKFVSLWHKPVLP